LTDEHFSLMSSFAGSTRESCTLKRDGRVKHRHDEF
jgi:hypothetical protein